MRFSGRAVGPCEPASSAFHLFSAKCFREPIPYLTEEDNSRRDRAAHNPSGLRKMPWSALETTIVPVPGSSLPTTMAEPLSCLSTRAPEMINQTGRQNKTEEQLICVPWPTLSDDRGG